MDTAVEERWRGRKWLTRTIKVGAVLVPLLASLIAAAMMASALPIAETFAGKAFRLLLIAAVATAVLFGVDRLARRALPLAALFDLTLMFPDKAPSRYRLALRTGSRKELEKRLVDFQASAATATPSEVAASVLELVAGLSRHDRLTRGHSERVRAYAELIGEEMGLDERALDRLRWSALLHDIGKLQIDAGILGKPGKLTYEEFAEIRKHPMLGKELSAPLHGWLGESGRAIWEHHERWDGGGYPAGLHGTDISMAGRIVAVADAYDVMTSIRSYKVPGSAAAARAELARCAGSQFDPAVVRAFMNVSLGRLRLAMGPASLLAQIAFVPRMVSSGSAAPVAAMAVIGMVTTGIGVAAAAPPTSNARPPGLAAAGPGESSTSLAPAPPASDEILPTVPPTAATTVPPRTATATTAPATTSATTALPTTVTTRPPTTTRPPITTTRPPTTTTRPPTTTVPATTTTVAATTTTAAATTTTVAATTTTTTTPPLTVTALLASSAVGDVAASAVLPMVVRAPLNVGPAVNLDTDRNEDPGLTLLRGGSLDTPGATTSQRFQYTPGSPVKLRGATSLVVFASDAGQQGGTIELEAGLYECSTAAATSCTLLADDTVESVVGASMFTPLTIDFGVVNETIPSSRRLEVRIVVGDDSSDDVWLSWDCVQHPSALTFLSD